MSFAIHTGIPVPTVKKTYKYPFSSMGVGATFFVEVDPLKDEDSDKVIARLKVAARNWKRETGNESYEFLVAVPDEGTGSPENSVGVWRTA